MRRYRKPFAPALTVLAVAALCLFGGNGAEAGKIRMRQRTAYRYSAPTCAAPAVLAQPVRVSPGPAPVAVQGEEGAFLGALNAWRASRGRGPVGWSPQLAGAAATNNAVHAPHSTGGGRQCWAGTGSLMQALVMWQASPAHASILLGATSVVGASPCATGATCNAL